MNKPFSNKLTRIAKATLLILTALVISKQTMAAESGSYMYLGTYPQTEVTGESLTNSITSAAYTNNVATVDGVKYTKIADKTTTRYFRHENIQWRVMNDSNGQIKLISTKALDWTSYSSGTTLYSTSSIKNFLETFHTSAFSEEERAKMSETPTLLTTPAAITISYGFTATTTASDTRVVTLTDYTKALQADKADTSYWIQGGYISADGAVNTITKPSLEYRENRCVVPVITLKSTTASTPSDTTGTLAAPTGVKVTNKTATSHKISWNTVSGADGYLVYVSTSKNGTYTLAKTATKNQTVIKKRKIGKKYFYKVSAFINQPGTKKEGIHSAIKSKMAGTPQRPVLKVTKTRKNGEAVVLCQWSKINDAKYIVISYSLNGGKYKKIYDTKLTAKTRKGCMLRVTSGSRIKVRIRTYCKAGKKKMYSKYSKAKSVTL